MASVGLDLAVLCIAKYTILYPRTSYAKKFPCQLISKAKGE